MALRRCVGERFFSGEEKLFSMSIKEGSHYDFFFLILPTRPPSDECIFLPFQEPFFFLPYKKFPSSSFSGDVVSFPFRNIASFLIRLPLFLSISFWSYPPPPLSPLRDPSFGARFFFVQFFFGGVCVFFGCVFFFFVCGFLSFGARAVCTRKQTRLSSFNPSLEVTGISPNDVQRTLTLLLLLIVDEFTFLESPSFPRKKQIPVYTSLPSEALFLKKVPAFRLLLSPTPSDISVQSPPRSFILQTRSAGFASTESLNFLSHQAHAIRR